MRKYELFLVLPGTLTEPEAEVRLAEVVKQVGQYASSAEPHTLGKNRLAYPINHIRYGYFYTVVFEAEPTAVKQLEQALALARDLLRALISHFNTTITASQQIAYSTNALGVTTMMEQPEPRPEITAPPSAVKEIDEVDINKKLEELMQGEVVSGV